MHFHDLRLFIVSQAHPPDELTWCKIWNGNEVIANFDSSLRWCIRDASKTIDLFVSLLIENDYREVFIPFFVR